MTRFWSHKFDGRRVAIVATILVGFLIGIAAGIVMK